LSNVGGSKSFIRLLKETSFAYFFGLGGIFAGFMVASYLGIFDLAPWTFALYPVLISAKGVTGGLLSGRLSTALHLGTVRPNFFNNTQTFYTLLAALIVLTLVTSMTISLFSLVFGQLFWGLTFIEFPGIILVVVTTMSMGLLLSFITINIAFLSFKKGSDPDIVVYPIMSTVSDIFITACYIFVLTLYFYGDIGNFFLLLISTFAIFAAIYVGLKNFHDKDFVKTIKESLVTMIFVAFMVNITGTVLLGIRTFVVNRKEIYTIYPALIGMIGNVGSVVGSTATTKLALGLLSPSFSSIKRHINSILSAWGASLFMFIILAFLSLILNGLFSFSSLIPFVLVLSLTNIFAVLAIVFLTFSISILTFKKGLDPDNFVIPVVSSFADLVTSIALLASLILIGLS